MKIALINENSQAAKNAMIYSALKKVVEPKGHEVFNYGMYGAEDEASINICSKWYSSSYSFKFRSSRLCNNWMWNRRRCNACCNSFPGVLCGHVVDPFRCIYVCTNQ